MKTRLRKLPRRLKDKPLIQEPIIESEDQAVTNDIDQNETFIKLAFQQCSDVIYREIRLQEDTDKQLLIYIGTLVDDKKVSEQIVRPLASKQDSQIINKKIITSKWEEIIQLILHGYAAVLTNKQDYAVCYEVKGSIERSIEEPFSEPVIRGPKEGFIERQSVNVGLLRHYIRTPHLKMEEFIVGKMTETKVMVSYIEGLADEVVLNQIRDKVNSIEIDGVLETAAIEELIVDDPFPIFPHVLATERPDVVAGSLLEGRIAILVDNTPFVLVVPATFWTGFQGSEDYNLSYPVATFIRLIRLIFLFVAVFAPSFFVAVTSFHQEMIPTSLLLSIASAREPVPFPIMIEALLMEIMFEALREAGVRIPQTMGQTVSIVGGLVIGQAAVQAGLISTPIVIVVSTTGIATLLIPRFTFANGIRLLRFPIIFLAGSLGLYGISLGFVGILLYVVHLKSFGVPYFTPIAPFSFRALKDVWVRAPRKNGRNLSLPSQESAVKAEKQKGGK